MSRQLWVNLPVSNVSASRAFAEALGLTINEMFTSEAACCVTIGEASSLMLLNHGFFSGFTPLPIADATLATEVIVALSAESREEVDDFYARALAAGGTSFRPVQDLGFMYCHAFRDLDGHIWEIATMDMEQFKAQKQGA
jgi:predicted lactoylglutathione lyase